MDWFTGEEENPQEGLTLRGSIKKKKGRPRKNEGKKDESAPEPVSKEPAPASSIPSSFMTPEHIYRERTDSHRQEEASTVLMVSPVAPVVFKPIFAEAIENVEKMCRMVEAASPQSEEDERILLSLAGDIKRLRDLIESTRLKVTKPYRDTVSSINGFASPFISRLEKYFLLAKSKISFSQAARRAAELKRQEEARQIAGPLCYLSIR